MASSINWQNLRVWNGSQQSAFEELCCQLAASEPSPPSAIFIRKAPPDAGVECYLRLPDGDEWAWQAKFFLSVPDEGQWRQMDESVRTALAKHPRLTSFTLCLPTDRQDPRIPGENWFMDKWEDRVHKWEQWSEEAGMAVDFRYWGEHEIFHRLGREEHRGRYLFWFNGQLFNETWFRDRLTEAIENAGERYTPEINVELPVTRLFDGLGRTPAFFVRLREMHGVIKKAFRQSLVGSKGGPPDTSLQALQEQAEKLFSLLSQITSNTERPLDLPAMSSAARSTRELGEACSEALRRLSRERMERDKQEKQAAQPDQSASRGEDGNGYRLYHLSELRRALYALEEFSESSEALLANATALLLRGEAGSGKTHLLCDVAERRLDAGMPTLLLLGEQFRDLEPWSQITGLLGLQCSREEFLGAMEASAQASDTHAVLMIDALNEGEGKQFWKAYLAGMLALAKRFPRVRITFTVRTSYEDVVIPAKLATPQLVKETHFGFADHEYQATETFFRAFGIKRPSVPLLNPEFQNPLFLKLFCTGLRNRGLVEVPAGFHGITTVFSFLIDSVNEKLSGAAYLDFDPKSRCVYRALEALAHGMAEARRQWLPREAVQSVINALLPREGYQNSLFRHLLSEGLIAEDRIWMPGGEIRDGIRFSYERLADHLIVSRLLDQHLDAGNPSDSFAPDAPLGALVADSAACHRNRGAVEALSIQLPERIGLELAEVAPICANFQPVRESFARSIVWRVPNAVTDGTRGYINNHLLRYSDGDELLMEALLTVATNTEHPLNADALHSYLRGFTMPDRDAWWSIYLHKQYGEHGAVDRLVEWASSPQDKSHIGDAEIFLAAQALAWFLTTSNRFLRDRTTKALVNLLTPRLNVLRALLDVFWDVNDLYVLERLLAVACGSALRSADAAGVGLLAQEVFDHIFAGGRPVPHVLLRDYARGVVESALHRGLAVKIKLHLLRPPYKSVWPADIPQRDELAHYGEYGENPSPSELARTAIYFSVMSWGDFSRYVIGTNSHSFEWSSRRLGQPTEPTRKERAKTFAASLTARQADAWKDYRAVRDSVNLCRRLSTDRQREVFKREYSEQELGDVIHRYEQRLRRLLGKRKREVLDQYLIPYLERPHEDELQFDLDLAQRYVLWRVFDQGWTAEQFGSFDRELNRYNNAGRSAHKAERIGKKYQWLAWHEFIALVSDNFEYRGDRYAKTDRKYNGPWQMGTRDIDPSCLLRETKRVLWQEHSQSWWFPVSYDAWATIPSDEEWLKSDSDLPPVPALIRVTNPDCCCPWLVLEEFAQWEQPIPIEEDRHTIARRQILYSLHGYVVRKADSDELYEWATQSRSLGFGMPQVHQLYDVMLGEFFWAPAFMHHNIPYFHHDGWTKGQDKLPREVLTAADGYMQEGSDFDCSIDETVHLCLPSKWLSDGMRLRHGADAGTFLDGRGEPACLDPSVYVAGPGALVMKQELLLSYLEEKECEILWVIEGEKRILSPNYERKGILNIRGAYRVRQGKITGEINTLFEA